MTMMQRVGTSDPPLCCPQCGVKHAVGSEVLLYGLAKVGMHKWPGGAEDTEIGTARARPYCSVTCLAEVLGLPPASQRKAGNQL